MKPAATLTLLIAVSTAGAANADEMMKIARLAQYMEITHQHHELVDTIHDTAAHPARSAILQLQKIQEINRNSGKPADTIRLLSSVVQSDAAPAVRNAAVTMLADALNEAGNTERAVEVLTEALQRNLNP